MQGRMLCTVYSWGASLYLHSNLDSLDLCVDTLQQLLHAWKVIGFGKVYVSQDLEGNN